MLNSTLQSGIRDKTTGARLGATIVEVLMGVLVMGVGATAVFTLFPIAVVTSLKATQLTNSRLFFENFVQVVSCTPQLVEGYPQWKPNMPYNGDPPPALPSGVTRVVPAGRKLSESSLIAIAISPGTLNSGVVEPDFSDLVRGVVSDGTAPVEWRSLRIEDLKDNGVAADGTSGLSSKYIIDPLGYHTIASITPTPQYSNPNLKTRFGANDDGSNTADNFPVRPLLIRHNASLTFDQAVPFFAMPDSWTGELVAVPVDIDITESPPGPITPATVTTTVLTFASSIDLSNFASSSRMIVRGTPGRGTTMHQLVPTEISGNVITITRTGAYPLPDSINDVAEVLQVRFETFTPRYSCFLTVNRKPDGTAKIACPVIFNRTFSSLDERVITAETNAGSPLILVEWLAGGKTPLIKENGFVFDAVEGEWYRIVDAPDDAVLLPATQYSVVLDRPLTYTRTLASATAGFIFVPGVIEVYEINL